MQGSVLQTESTVSLTRVIVTVSMAGKPLQHTFAEKCCEARSLLVERSTRLENTFQALSLSEQDRKEWRNHDHTGTLSMRAQKHSNPSPNPKPLPQAQKPPNIHKPPPKHAPGSEPHERGRPAY